jgi:hypothetical protein
VNHDIPTPKTVKLDPASPPAFPFFLKVSSGTNGGRGVWLCRDQKALDSALAVKSNKEPGTLLLAQTPEFGKLVCAQVVYVESSGQGGVGGGGGKHKGLHAPRSC